MNKVTYVSLSYSKETKHISLFIHRGDNCKNYTSRFKNPERITRFYTVLSLFHRQLHNSVVVMKALEDDRNQKMFEAWVAWLRLYTDVEEVFGRELLHLWATDNDYHQVD